MSIATRVVFRYASSTRTAGATTFENFSRNTDVGRAYRELVDDARHEYGHGGYSGTIAEKNGYKVRSNDPMTHTEARKFIEKDIDQNDKWGPAFAVPICDTEKGKEKQVTVKVTAAHERGVQEKAEDMLTEKFSVPGIDVKVKVTKVTKLKSGALPEIIPAKGTEDGFRVWSTTISFAPNQERVRTTFYNSRAEAIAAIKAAIPHDRPQPGAKYVIEKVKVSDVLTIGDTSKAVDTFEVEATVSLNKKSPKVIGWMFYGWASE